MEVSGQMVGGMRIPLKPATRLRYATRSLCIVTRIGWCPSTSSLFAHGTALEIKLVRIVYQPVEDGIDQGLVVQAVREDGLDALVAVATLGSELACGRPP